MTESFIFGFRQEFSELRIEFSPMIFYQFCNAPIKQLIQKGEQLVKIRDEKLEYLVKQKRVIIFYNGSKGYCVDSNDAQIVNSLAAKLANMSKEVGMSHVGTVYHKLGISNQTKVHLRGCNDGECFRCDQIAEHYGGGGHVGAASFFINNNQLKRMINK